MRLRFIPRPSQPKRSHRSPRARSGLVRGGSAAYHEQAQHLRPGFTTLQEFYEWPDSVCDSLVGADSGDQAAVVRAARLRASIGSGIVCHTDYSGQLAPETALRMMGLCLQERLSLPSPAHCLASWATCDTAPMCTRLARDSKFPPEHIFSNVLDRLPPKLRAEVDALTPPRHAAIDERLCAHASIDRLLEGSRDAFSPSSTSRCILHSGRRCRLRWEDPELPPSRRPLTLNVSGPTCLGWTPYGGQEGQAHESAVPWMVWAKSVRGSQFDITVMENSSRMPPGLFRAELAASGLVHSVVLGPDDFGWPVRRRRLFSWVTTRSSVVWFGPNTDEGIKADILRFFGRRVAVDAAIFAGIDAAEEIRDVRRCFGKRAGLPTEDR